MFGFSKRIVKIGRNSFKIDKNDEQGEQNINEAVKLFGNEKEKKVKHMVN